MDALSTHDPHKCYGNTTSILMFSSLLIRFAELEHYTSLPVQPIQAGLCDVVVNRPTVFMKLDAGVLNTFCTLRLLLRYDYFM